MFKQIIKGIAVGSAALLMAGNAAALTEVHIFGASAQYKFWTAAAPQFLADENGCNCTSEDGVSYYARSKYTHEDYSKRDTGVAIGNGCLGINEQVVISYTTYASYEGIRAVRGTGSDPDGCGDEGQRAVADWNDKDGDELSVSGGSPYYNADNVGEAGTVNDLVCDDIVIGASDVAGETFGQTSLGNLYGPNGTEEDDGYNPVITAEDTDGLDYCRPIVVPFAFFGDADLPTDNLTRLMATAIFSGTVANWSDFGYDYDQTITLCMRHAGSGTHATLNAAVLRGDIALPTEEVLFNDPVVTLGFSPAIYFNKGSSDLIACIETIGDGAIGYADADKNGEAADGSNGNSAIKRLEYMGEDGTAETIKNGLYDFWSAQWLYYSDDESGNTLDVINKLCSYAAIGDNIPSSKSAFWAAEGDMNVEKATDFSWPTRK